MQEMPFLAYKKCRQEDLGRVRGLSREVIGACGDLSRGPGNKALDWDQSGGLQAFGRREVPQHPRSDRNYRRAFLIRCSLRATSRTEIDSRQSRNDASSSLGGTIPWKSTR